LFYHETPSEGYELRHPWNLRSVGYSDDILPIQAKFENKKGQATCTERDFIEIYQSKRLLFLRTEKIMWLMIDASCSGYLEFRAMIYGRNPGRYWIDILRMAHCWAIDYFLGLHRSVNFKLTLIKSPHFCAVNRGCALSQRLSMDSAVTKFLGVEKKCTYFQDTDFPKLHFDSGKFNPMLHFFHEWTPEDRVISKLSSITLSEFLTAYLSKWNGKIIKYLNSTGNQIISPNDITIHQLASYYSHTGGKGNLGKKGKKLTEEHRANISAGNLGKKLTEEQEPTVVQEIWARREPKVIEPTLVQELWARRKPKSTKPTLVQELWARRKPKSIEPTLVQELQQPELNPMMTSCLLISQKS
jgi:hypothetical protein